MDKENTEELTDNFINNPSKNDEFISQIMVERSKLISENYSHEDLLTIAAMANVLNSLAMPAIVNYGDVLGKHIKLSKSQQGKKASHKRLQFDAKQKALRAIEIEFMESKIPFYVRGHTAKFIRDMQDKYPIIECPKSIERRVRKLKNTPRTG